MRLKTALPTLSTGSSLYVTLLFLQDHGCLLPRLADNLPCPALDETHHIQLYLLVSHLSLLPCLPEGTVGTSADIQHF